MNKVIVPLAIMIAGFSAMSQAESDRDFTEVLHMNCSMALDYGEEGLDPNPKSWPLKPEQTKRFMVRHVLNGVLERNRRKLQGLWELSWYPCIRKTM